MGRKLATLILPAVMGYSAAGMALGLGGIETESSLNEPFSARIMLRSATDAELQNLRISLGSQEAFQRAGMSRSFMLSQLQFEVVADADPPYIRVSSREVVREPFLDFLVEARWPQGRLLREYTVLLDPPLYSAEAEVPATGDATASAPQPAPESESASESTGATATAVRAQAAAPAPVSASAGPGESYGPVQADQTLYRIASEIRPEGVSVNQTMLALLRANPEAFINGNINRLRRGAVLRVPEREEFTRISASAATASVREQMASWRAEQAVAGVPADDEPVARAAAEADDDAASGVAAGSADEPASDEVAAADGEDIDVAAGDEATPMDDEVAEPESELSVVALDEGADSETSAGVDEDVASGDAEVAEMRSRMALLEEMNASLESENADLRGQVAGLKEELIELRRMINLRMEESLASGVQSEPRAGQDELEEDDAPVVASAGGEPQPGSGEPEPASSPTDGIAEAERSETAVAQPEADPAPTDDPAEAVTPQSEESFLASLTNNTQLMSIGGGAIVALLLLALVMRRRRSDDDLDEELEPIAVGGGAATADAGAGESEAIASERAVEVPQAETVGEATEAPEIEESDPLEQAELYVALGNHEKAQQILDDALGAEPDAPELRYKLLEVLSERGDRAGFEAEAQVFHAQVDGTDDERWQSVVAMGRQIAPEHPLFSASESEPSMSPDANVADAGDGAFDLDVDESAATAFTDATDDTLRERSSAAAVDDTDFDLDFDLDGAASESDRAAATAVPETDADSDFDLDFTLDDDERELPGERARADAATGTPEQADDESDEGLAFELPERLDPPAADTGSAEASVGPEDDDLDFGDLEFEAPPERSEQPAADSNDAAGDDDFDLDALDEAGTKLDLARAYLDMGDSDGARSLLDEVAEEGNDSQKQEAETLRRQVG